MIILKQSVISSKKYSKWKIKQNWVLYAFLIPSAIILLVFAYLPMYGTIMAFQDFRPGLGFFRSDWVGLYWFNFLYEMPGFGRIISNTLVIALWKIILGQAVPIAFALLLNEIKLLSFKKLVQTFVYLPHFLSWVIVGGLFLDILSSDGIVNRTIVRLGFEPIPFLVSNDWFQFTLISTEIWKGFGWGAIIYLAALTGINLELYESAHIEGANRWQRMWYITLPGIRSTIVLLAALSIGGILNAGFEQILIMYNPAVYQSGDVIDTFIFRQGLTQMQFSLSAAVGLFRSVIAFFLILLSNKLAEKYANYRIF